MQCIDSCCMVTQIMPCLLVSGRCCPAERGGCMAKPRWQVRAWEIHQEYVRRAAAKGNLTSEAEVINFLALAICGEAGELANCIKKMWRGDSIPSEDGARDHRQVRRPYPRGRLLLPRVLSCPMRVRSPGPGVIPRPPGNFGRTDSSGSARPSRPSPRSAPRRA